MLCKGCTRAEAFDIGQQIVDRVTAQNPWPVKLKLVSWKRIIPDLIRYDLIRPLGSGICNNFEFQLAFCRKNLWSDHLGSIYKKQPKTWRHATSSDPRRIQSFLEFFRVRKTWYNLCLLLCFYPWIKLLFIYQEKVYQPCILFAKKRYAGMAYENVGEQEGKFDAKGIETVRRDSPLFVSKVGEIKDHFFNGSKINFRWSNINFLGIKLTSQSN